MDLTLDLSLPIDACYKLDSRFSWDDYIEIERELWILFPETEGKRTTYVTSGLSNLLFVETDAQGPLRLDETYLLLPHADCTMRPIRMAAVRRLTVQEYRFVTLSGVKMSCVAESLAVVFRQVAKDILGESLIEELDG